MKIAWFQGDIEHPATDEWMTMDGILALPEGDPRQPTLKVLLVPDDFDITGLRGDDWDDAPAFCNAGAPYDSSLPDGAMWLYLRPGWQWRSFP